LLPDYFDSEGVGMIQCLKEEGRTHFRVLPQVEGLFRKPEVEKALEETLPSERILRGDWG
jgi:hypothetical protein